MIKNNMDTETISLKTRKLYCILEKIMIPKCIKEIASSNHSYLLKAIIEVTGQLRLYLRNNKVY